MSIKSFLSVFNLSKERESFEDIQESIIKSAEIKGTNLWILFFAILLASLGLNINSTSVVIGAMLISPVIGPILGIGFAVGTYNHILLKKSLLNYGISAGFAIVSSTLFFILTPLDHDHSELLARTNPTIYDVFIALFGGFAVIIALSSKLKGNVIPGVAIATAIMPPLCTVGYGIATLNWAFFIGAFYLFLINSVFIFTATLIGIRFLKFPIIKKESEQNNLKANWIIWTIVSVTLIPSIYLGYKMIHENKYLSKANLFIKKESTIDNEYLLKAEVDAENQEISLTYAGKKIKEEEVLKMQEKLVHYNLKNTHLNIRHGLTLDDKSPSKEMEKQVLLNQLIHENNQLQQEIASEKMKQKTELEVREEFQVLFPKFKLISLKMVDSISNFKMYESRIEGWNKVKSKKIIYDWLKLRLKSDSLLITP